MNNTTKKIELLELHCENFKGLEKFSQDFGGADATITAANGVGKTTVYDMFLWLLFGKDSTGRTDSGKGKFEVRPLQYPTALGHLGTQPIKGIEVMVETTLGIAGTEHTFKRVQKENVVKHQLRGYTTDYCIDGIPKPEKYYKPFIDEIITEHIFKVLTDLSYFNGKMHWTDRKQVLLAIAGDVGTPAGFEALVAALNGRDIAAFGKVLAGQKKLCEKERNEINPRIDEIHKGMDGYVAEDTDKLQEQRKGVEQTIEGLDGERTRLLATEKQRQGKIDDLNKLTCQRLHRESELKNDTSGTKALIEEKAQIEVTHSEKKMAVVNLQSEISHKSTALEALRTALETTLQSRKSVYAEYQQAKEKPIDSTCYACGQELPEDKAAELEAKRQTELAEIEQRGNNLKTLVDERKTAIDHSETEIRELASTLEHAKVEFEDYEESGSDRIKEIDELIKSNPKTKPADDGQWQDFTVEIEKLQAEIGEPVSEQLETIETNRKAAHDVLNKLNESLAQADRIEKDRKRIAEYEDREIELAQLIADIEKQLSEIEQYKAEVSRRIQAAVNDKFKHVEFKMFEQQLNGEIDNNHCEATYRGVPYPDMSTGQKIICGVDIVNVLSEHYGVSVPLFVDHAESLTLPLEARSQTIELYAEEGVDELRVEIAERTAAA